MFLYKGYTALLPKILPLTELLKGEETQIHEEEKEATVPRNNIFPLKNKGDRTLEMIT